MVLKDIKSNPSFFKKFLDTKESDYTKSKIENLLFPIVYRSKLNNQKGFLTSVGKYDLKKILKILQVLG